MKYLPMWGIPSYSFTSQMPCMSPSVTALCRKGMMTPQHHADGELTSSSHWEDTEARGSCKQWGQSREGRGEDGGEGRGGRDNYWVLTSWALHLPPTF